MHRLSPLTGPGSDIDHVVPDGGDVQAFVDETEVAYCWLCSLDQFGKIGSGARFPAHRVSCCNDCFHEFRVRCGNNGVCFLEVAVRVPFTNSISMISSITVSKTRLQNMDNFGDCWFKDHSVHHGWGRSHVATCICTENAFE